MPGISAMRIDPTNQLFDPMVNRYDEIRAERRWITAGTECDFPDDPAFSAADDRQRALFRD